MKERGWGREVLESTSEQEGELPLAQPLDSSSMNGHQTVWFHPGNELPKSIFPEVTAHPEITQTPILFYFTFTRTC